MVARFEEEIEAGDECLLHGTMRASGVQRDYVNHLIRCIERQQQDPFLSCPLEQRVERAVEQAVEHMGGTPAAPPPCRVAAQYFAPCPLCGRELRLKTLRYSHVCSKPSDPANWAQGMHAAAIEAVNARVAGGERTTERRLEHDVECEEVKMPEAPSGRVAMKGIYDHLLTG